MTFTHKTARCTAEHPSSEAALDCSIVIIAYESASTWTA